MRMPTPRVRVVVLSSSNLVVWQCFPQLVLTIQEESIDYIGGFFPVVDCYLNIEWDS